MLHCFDTIQGHKYSVNCLTVFDGYLWSGSYDTTIKWDSSGSCIGTFKGRTGWVRCLTVFNGYLWSVSDAHIEKWRALSLRKGDFQLFPKETQKLIITTYLCLYKITKCRDMVKEILYNMDFV